MIYNFEILKERTLNTLNLTTSIKKLNKIKGPTICVGSGGSNVVAAFASIILNTKNSCPTKVCEPRDVLYENLENYKNLFVCSYSGNNHGVNILHLAVLRNDEENSADMILRVDSLEVEEILQEIDGYRKAKNATIMMVSHSMTDVARLADRLFVMNDAKLAMDGTPEQVFTHAQELVEMGLDIPEVTKLFLHLQKLGLPVTPVYTLEQAVDALRELKEGNAHA